MYFSISVSTQIINLINAFAIPLRERETLNLNCTQCVHCISVTETKYVVFINNVM